MKSRRFLDSRVGYMFASIVTLLGIAAPALVTGVASAGVATERSMQLSDSSAGKTGVNYTLTFTPTSTQPDAVVMVDFCDDSPIIGTACNAPTGFTAAGATLPSGVTASATHLEVAQALVADTPVSLTFNNITNPTSATTLSTGLYARIYTYDDDTDAGTYSSVTSLGTTRDTGGIAIAITNPIQISAAVRESMTFCVAKVALTANCANAAANPPTLELGHGTPLALDSSQTNYATAYTQISTNASKGAIVNMKTDNLCGGLFRQGESDTSVCGIAPVGTGHDPITAGVAAKFGMRVDTIDTSISGSSGTINPATNYGQAAEYGMNWVSGNATGVGGPYGDPIYDTDETPNINVPLVFAATVTNTTAAGLYKANLNLIATGTY